MFLLFFFSFLLTTLQPQTDKISSRTSFALVHIKCSWNAKAHASYKLCLWQFYLFYIEHWALCSASTQDFCYIIYVLPDTVCCMLIHILTSIHSFLFLFNQPCKILSNKFCLQKFSILYTLHYWNIIIFDFYRKRNGFGWYGELWTNLDTLLWIGYILRSNCTRWIVCKIGYK